MYGYAQMYIVDILTASKTYFQSKTHHLHMKSSDAKASMPFEIFFFNDDFCSSLMMIFVKLVYLSSVISLK